MVNVCTMGIAEEMRHLRTER